MRRHFHGSARQPRASIIRWTESVAPKKFAEDSSRVKSCSCCRFLTVAHGALLFLVFLAQVFSLRRPMSRRRRKSTTRKKQRSPTGRSNLRVKARNQREHRFL